ncbi:MAG TPA: SHOCT domain-containing protein [Candidatus Didemnitutus sp.]|nr:SHOCT domain-containing protein [Candidatus Didemnitutus sp.]
MNLRTLGWLAMAMLMLGGSAPLRAGPDEPNPPVVALGNDTYVITRRATFFFFRNTSKLVTRARADAEKFCHDLHREMKEVSVEEVPAGLIIGEFAKAQITFKALLPGDPALATAPTPMPAAAVPAAPQPNPTDLTKLEELHRGGVVTDPEFDAAKKRLYEQSLEDLHAKGVLSDQEFEAARKRLNEH